MRNEGWARGLRVGLSAYEAQHDGVRVTQKWIGERVAELVGEPTPFSNAVVSKWFRGRVPDFRVGIALCVLLSIEPIGLACLDAPGAAGSATRRQVAELPPVAAEELRPPRPARKRKRRHRRG